MTTYHSNIYRLCFAVAFLFSNATAHEPIFGIGSDLIRKGGFGIEVEAEHEHAGEEKETILSTQIMYGITEYLAISAEMPFFLNVEQKKNGAAETYTSAGLGKIETRAKLRIYHNYQYGLRDQIALIGGIKWPSVGLTQDPNTGLPENGKNPSLGNNSTDFLFALAVGREILQGNFFGTLQYAINTRTRNIKQGNELTLTLAAGFRPMPITYYGIDWLFSLEFDFINSEKDLAMGAINKNSGGYTGFFGPVVFVSKENIAIKAGIQAPIFERLNDPSAGNDFRYAVGLDLHF